MDKVIRFEEIRQGHWANESLLGLLQRGICSIAVLPSDKRVGLSCTLRKYIFFDYPTKDAPLCCLGIAAGEARVYLKPLNEDRKPTTVMKCRRSNDYGQNHISRSCFFQAAWALHPLLPWNWPPLYPASDLHRTPETLHWTYTCRQGKTVIKQCSLSWQRKRERAYNAMLVIEKFRLSWCWRGKHDRGDMMQCILLSRLVGNQEHSIRRFCNQHRFLQAANIPLSIINAPNRKHTWWRG